MAGENGVSVISGKTGLVAFIFYFLFFFLSLNLFGQSEGMNEGIDVSISPKKPSVGKNFTFEIFVKGNFFSSVKVVPPAYLGGFKIVEGPYIRPNIEENGIIITFVLKALRRGERVLRSFTVLVNSNVYKTPPVKIEVITIKPVLRWSLEGNEFLVGETFPATLELVLWDRIEMPVKISTRAPADSWFEEFFPDRVLKSEEVDGKKKFLIPLKSFLVTFGKAGRFRFPPARVILPNGAKLYTPLKVITVKKPPKKIKSSYAIGKYSYTYSVDKREVEVGKEFTVTVKIEGWGNFNYFRFPVPIVKGSSVGVVNERKELISTSNGYKGFREKSYRFKVERVGNLECTIPDFVYLDRLSRKVRILKGKRFKLKVVKPVEEKRVIKSFPIRGYDEFLESLQAPFYTRWSLILWFLPGILFYGIIMLMRRYKDKREGMSTLVGIFFMVFVLTGMGSNIKGEYGHSMEVVKDKFDGAYRLYLKGDYKSSAALFEELLHEKFGKNSVLLYNLAVCYYHVSDYVNSLHYIRTLLKYNPGDSEAREFLLGIEKKLSLENSIYPSLNIGFRYWVVAILVVFNLFFVLFALYRLSDRLGFLFFSLLMVTCFVLGVGLLAYTYYYNSRSRGIIARDGVYILRVPDKDAHTKTEVKAGSSLYVEGRAENYVLVRTDSGDEGWVESDDVLLD